MSSLLQDRHIRVRGGSSLTLRQDSTGGNMWLLYGRSSCQPELGRLAVCSFWKPTEMTNSDYISISLCSSRSLPWRSSGGVLLGSAMSDPICLDSGSIRLDAPHEIAPRGMRGRQVIRKLADTDFQRIEPGHLGEFRRLTKRALALAARDTGVALAVHQRRHTTHRCFERWRCENSPERGRCWQSAAAVHLRVSCCASCARIR